MTDDDIRDMLRTKAAEARVSPDAWDKIAVRLDDAERKVRHLPRRLALVGVAAAAVAGIVVLANRPATDGPATQATTTTADPGDVVALPADRQAVHEAVSAWLTRVLGDRFDRSVVVPADVQIRGESARATIDAGGIATVVSLQRLSGRKGWGVIRATSALVLIDDPTYDGHDLVAEAVPAAEGDLTTTYIVDGDERPGGTNHVAHEAPGLGLQVDGAQGVTVRVVLVTADGTTAIAEEPARILRDPATPTGSYVALFPSTDSVGLATLQQQADNHRRDDLLDPKGVAGNALYELLPRGETSTSYEVGDFQLGDPTSGEVPYTLSDGGSGTVLLNRTAPNDKTKIWYVTGVTSDGLEVIGYRHESGALVVDVRSSIAGTLTMPGATAPVDVKAGETVSITRPEKDAIQSSAPVELRLLAKGKTLAVLAELPR